MQALADVAAADAVAAKGGLHANAGQVKLALRSIVTDAVQRGMQSSAEAPATVQQSVLRHTLAKHGDQNYLVSHMPECSAQKGAVFPSAFLHLPQTHIRPKGGFDLT